MLRNVAVLKEAVRGVTSRLPTEALENEARLYSALQEVEEVELGWNYVLIPSVLPNAFVSEILLHLTFITTSILQKFVPLQNKLAPVLGHEILHLILGHSSTQKSLGTSFHTMEILLLSIDPSKGLLLLAFMSFLTSLRGAIVASHSLENERTADELGIKLTAMACYNVRAASWVFHKMLNIESRMESSSRKVGWGGLHNCIDLHPSSGKRFCSLFEENKTVNAQKYKDAICATLKTLFWVAMKLGSGSPMEDDGEAIVAHAG
ncbi:hypothetical protein ACHAW6_001744 [Cyclotella cf. meneghiniana]